MAVTAVTPELVEVLERIELLVPPERIGTGRESRVPIPIFGLEFPEAGYEIRSEDAFPGFRCRDCRYSVTPRQELGPCSFIKKIINNPRGCCIYYAVRDPRQIEAAFQPDSAHEQVAAQIRGVTKIVKELPVFETPTEPRRRRLVEAVDELLETTQVRR